MTHNMIEAKKAPSYALATTGLASVAALMSGTVAAQAQDSYIGLSYGVFQGDSPTADMAFTPEDYELDGGAIGFFAGRELTTVGIVRVGAEVAYTSFVEADPNEESEYDDAYGINWMLDLKLRAATDVGPVMVYGFAGVTTGKANNYYFSGDGNGYGFSGANYGLGAQMDFAGNTFVGAEVIQRSLSSYGAGQNIGADNAVQTEISLRAGFKF